MVFAVKDPFTFDELMATPIDFFKYAMNRRQIDNLTQEILVGPVYNLLKGTCTNPEKKYTTSITKTKAAQYEIVEIKYMVLTLWSTTKVGYDKDAKKGIKHWGKRRKLRYGHLEEIVVRRADRQVYKFKEGDFVDLHLNDIEDMLLLVVQHKLFQLDGSDIVDLIVALRITLHSIIQSNSKNSTLNRIRDELHHRILDFRLGYNKEMSRRKWTSIDKRRSELMDKLIDKHMRERRIVRNLERLVGAWELEMDYKILDVKTKL
nr:hypothetical protein [Tanacetum cinerariifolium]